MLVIETKNYKEMSKVACIFLIKEILKKPNIVLGFATGSTPLGLYKCLVKEYKKKGVNFSKVKSFNLDEYYPIKKIDKNSYYYYMFRNLFSKVNFEKSNINFLNGETKDAKKECLNYEKKIKKNPIDIQILGVGVNSHIAFDEPGSSFESKTRLVKLTKSTLKQNSKFFKNKKEIPKKALTMGIKTILRSKKILLLASGKQKAEAISHLLEGKVDKKYPISILKKHKNLIVIVDKEALR
ncbi:MAG: glucosamine-6-phosphate deaminase [archaeon]